MDKLLDQSWPFNRHAAVFLMGMFSVAFGSELKWWIGGLAICMLSCTSQICHTIRDVR